MMIRIVIILTAVVAAYAQTLPSYDHRIVGGDETYIEKYPHQVSLEMETKHHCGGSIISATHVVTAAHCVFQYDVRIFTVREGTTIRESTGERHFVEWYRHFDDFEIQTVQNDVAVLKLETPIVFTQSASPIKLVPEGQEPQQGEMVTVTGWGRTSLDNDDLPKNLQVVRLSVIDRFWCRLSYGETKITDTMFCAGAVNKDTCKADSGGPLINDRKELAGIVSWGKACGKAGYPGVYTNIAHPKIRNFIIENSKE